MRKLLLLIITIVSVFLTLPCFALQSKNVRYVETEIALDSVGFAVASEMSAHNIGSSLADMKMRVRNRVIDSDGVVCKVVDNAVPGKLAEAIGDDINEVDSLVVKGTINHADFKTLWSAAFHGKVTVLNLEDCLIEENTIPDNAFWNQKVQMPGDGYTYVVALQRVILPKTLDSIGDKAFAYAYNLTRVDFPAHLEKIGNHAFFDCRRLSNNPLVIPEGTESIGEMAFTHCYGLAGSTLVLPASIKEVNDYAFYTSRLGNIEFLKSDLPENKQISLGESVFAGCELTEVCLPPSLGKGSGGNQFAQNFKLEKFVFEDILDIPESFFQQCIMLKEVQLGKSVVVLDKGCFEGCRELENITLPYSVGVILSDAFKGCPMKSIVLPPRVEYLYENSLNIGTLESLYSMNLRPPVCPAEDPVLTPFGAYHVPIVNRDIPVYVPIGTAEKYRNTRGWDYFTNFIETEDFPSSVGQIVLPSNTDNDVIYDLTGNRVKTPIPGNIYIRNNKKIIYQEK